MFVYKYNKDRKQKAVLFVLTRLAHWEYRLSYFTERGTIMEEKVIEARFRKNILAWVIIIASLIAIVIGCVTIYNDYRTGKSYIYTSLGGNGQAAEYYTKAKALPIKSYDEIERMRREKEHLEIQRFLPLC